MDEEEILRSSLEESKKIDISNFFASPIGGLANRAVLQSNTSLKASASNRNLIRALQTSLESLRSQVQQITNYILVDKQERGKILRQRELEEFEREDDIQKGLVRPESAQPRGLEDAQPFFPENRFSQGLTAGMSSIGEPKGVAKFQQEVGQEVEGSTPFFFGGLVPGRGNADTVNAKLTPGEFVVPKEKVEELGSNPLMDFVKGGGVVGALSRALTGGKEKKSRFSKENYDMGRLSRKDFKNDEDYEFYINQFGDDFNVDSVKSDDKTSKSGSDYFVNPEDATNMLDAPRYVRGADGKFVAAPTTEQLTKGFSTYPIDEEIDKMDAEIADFESSVTAKGENKRGLFGAIGGTIDAATGNLTDFDRRGGKPSGLMRGITGTIDAATGGLTDLDRRGGKPFGLMRGITGTIDAATGGLTDLDRRGGKPFGLMRGITGSIDAMTGGLTDLDRRGGKPFGTMRLATGVADAMTGNLFDLDRRGDGKQKQLRPSQDPSHPMYQKIQQLKNKANQLPMETTVNPDGSITSEGSGTFIGGELVKPGEPLTPMQRAAMTMNIQMGNTYSSEMMEKYNDAGGAPSKEEFDSYEKEKSKSVKPDKEKSKNLKPEQTLGERFMNMFRGDKKEKSGQLLSSAPSSKYRPNTSISSDDSIKTAAQGIIQPPQGGSQSETVVLPEQSGGSPTGSIDQTSTSPFTSSTPSHSELGPTSSPVPFIDVISNQYLSVV